MVSIEHLGGNRRNQGRTGKKMVFEVEGRVKLLHFRWELKGKEEPIRETEGRIWIGRPCMGLQGGKSHAFGHQKVIVDLGEKAFRVEWS